MAEDPQCFAVRKQTTLTSPSLGLAAARNAFSVSLRTKKGPKKSAVPRNTTLSGSGSCKECLPCCFHIQTGPPTRARCLKIRPSVAFAPAGNAFPISRSQQGTPSWCLSRAKKVPLCCCGNKETIAPPSSPLLGTCFASFGKPFKLKTPKDRTAVSSVLSLSLAHAVKEDKNGFHKHTMRTQPCMAKDIAKPNK